MIFASKENLSKLYKLENEYFNLKGVIASESARNILQGELVKGFVKSEENVNEAIEKLTIKIEELKTANEEKVKAKEESIKKQEEKGFATLKGSEKQIKWANDLRDKFINDINRMKEESKEDKDLKVLNTYFYTKGIKDKKIDFDLIEETLNKILKEKDDAKFYINNRLEKAIDIIIEEIKK